MSPFSMSREEQSYRVLYMIDISSFIFRAFYAIREMSAPDGTPVNAVYGVASMLGKLMDEARPHHLVVVYDSKEPSFRKLKYEAYKANRSAPPETLLPQFDLIEELIAKMGIPSFRKSGVEADDIIATLAKKWVAVGEKTKKKNRVVMVTGDKDLMALVNPNTQLWDTMKDQHFTDHEVIEKFGVKPSQIRDYLAIVGDSSDNIPGITGIGPKGAEALLKEFETLEGVITAAKAGKIKGKKCETIVEQEKQALLSQELATLQEDIEIDFNEEKLAFEFQVKPELLEFFQKYNLRQLYTKYSAKLVQQGGAPQEAFSLESSAADPVASPKKPTATDAPTFDFTEQMAISKTTAAVQTSAAVKPVFKTVSDLAALKSLVSEIEKAGLMAFDTETTSLDPRAAQLVGMAISTGENGYYIPVGHEMTLESQAPQLTIEEALGLLKPLLESSTIKKIGQNLKYDYRVMLAQGVKMEGIYADTMIASHLVDSSGRHNLDDLSQKYLHYKPISYDEVAGKGAQQVTFDRVSIQAATEYSAEDAWCSMMLWKVLEPRLKNSMKLFKEVDIPIVEVVAMMEEAGIKVDVPFLKKLDVMFEKELIEIEAKVRSFSSNKTLNLNSPKQLAVFLFEELKLPPKGKTKTGYSTDASVLAELATEHEIPKMLLEYREIAKLRGTYVQPLQELRDSKDFRVRTSFNLTGAATGRLSSTDPNLQNIPARSKRGMLIREAFIAEKGNVLLSADYSQVELRILAHLSEDPNLIDSFVKDEDVHRRTASEIFHIKPEEVTDAQRSGAKAINFGLMYGKGAFALAEELSISRTEAKKMIEQYFARYSKVKEFLDTQIEFAREHGFTVTMLGRQRAIPEIKSQNHMMRANGERMAMNAPIQGTASDLIKTAMVRVDHVLREKKLKTKMLLQVHDELVFECPEAEVETVKTLVKDCMENAIAMRVPLRVNIGVGQNWAEL